jgi:hypothetical protein
MPWMPVSLEADWAKPEEEDTVNVGTRVHVFALWMPDHDDYSGSDWRAYPKWAMVIRFRYRGSEYNPSTIQETLLVEARRINLQYPKPR